MLSFCPHEFFFFLPRIWPANRTSPVQGSVYIRLMQDDSLETLSDDELLRRLADLTRQSRRVEADLVAHVAEVDARKLYAREAAPSMYVYCTAVLHLSEAEAYMRIRVARASREHPQLIDMLRDGRLHLTGASILVPHLTRENALALLKRATHCSRREIEEQVAELAPRPSVPPSVRRLPDRREVRERPVVEVERDGDQLRSNGVGPGPQAAADGLFSALPLLEGAGQSFGDPLVVPIQPPALARPPAPIPPATRNQPRADVRPLGGARYRVQFTASARLRDKLERLQALMRSQAGDVDLAVVVEQAVTEKLERLEARRFATTSRPRPAPVEPTAPPSSRHVPAAVRRTVHDRDDGQCRYVAATGRRCSERHVVEFHHRHPFAMGGEHSSGNIRLMCRVHNGYLARLDYGPAKMARFARPADAQAAQPRSLRESDPSP